MFFLPPCTGNLFENLEPVTIFEGGEAAARPQQNAKKQAQDSQVC